MPAPSVYNLEIAPLRSRQPFIVLDSSRIAEAKLGIGPRQRTNLLSDTQVDERIRERAAGRKAPINVQMVCNVCATNATQNRVIEFDPATTSSTTATFEIDVDPTTKGRMGRIYFRLSMGGQELNLIEVNAFVDAVPERTAGYREPRVDFVALPSDVGRAPDLTLSVTPDSATGRLAVTLEPTLPELAEALKGLVSDSAGNPRKFSLRHDSSADELKRRSGEAYRRLRQMTSPDPATRSRLENMYKAVNLPTFEGGFPSDAVRLIPAHRDEALRVFKVAGQDMYRAIFTTFFGAHADLQKAMATVEAFSPSERRPLRVSIVSPYFLPWQLLYPNSADVAYEDVQGSRFWGFKYELSVRQMVSNQEHRLEAVALRPTTGNVLFAKGRRRSESDPVESLADELMKRFYSSGGLSAARRVVTSSKDFVSALDSGAEDLMLVFLFSHATSGSHMQWSDDLPSGVTDDIGPRIEFGANDWVVPLTIERIFDRHGSLPVWKRQPIFVLNACETGTGGNSPANSGLFVSTLSRLGANAVVVTESEVWAKFASAWAGSLLDGLRRGDDMPRAVRNARLKHLQQDANPMGLLYSLYGSPSSRIVMPSGGF